MASGSVLAAVALGVARVAFALAGALACVLALAEGRRRLPTPARHRPPASAELARLARRGFSRLPKWGVGGDRRWGVLRP